MEVEIIASKEQCGSEILFYGIGVLEPSAHTGLHVHDDVEIAWFMLEGDTPGSWVIRRTTITRSRNAARTPQAM